MSHDPNIMKQLKARGRHSLGIKTSFKEGLLSADEADQCLLCTKDNISKYWLGILSATCTGLKETSELLFPCCFVVVLLNDKVLCQVFSLL